MPVVAGLPSPLLWQLVSSTTRAIHKHGIMLVLLSGVGGLRRKASHFCLLRRQDVICTHTSELTAKTGWAGQPLPSMFSVH